MRLSRKEVGCGKAGRGGGGGEFLVLAERLQEEEGGQSAGAYPGRGSRWFSFASRRERMLILRVFWHLAFGIWH